MSSRLRRSQKRRSRENSLENGKSYTDFLCPICLEILIEPVQMPCKHELCMECFKGHVEDTSLTCPMCRLRIAVWVRKNMKSNTLINKERWELIKRLFPDRVKRRLEGGDDLEESFSIYNGMINLILQITFFYRQGIYKLHYNILMCKYLQNVLYRVLLEELTSPIRQKESCFNIFNFSNLAPKHVIAPQGEVRREFEEQMKKVN